MCFIWKKASSKSRKEVEDLPNEVAKEDIKGYQKASKKRIKELEKSLLVTKFEKSLKGEEKVTYIKGIVRTLTHPGLVDKMASEMMCSNPSSYARDWYSNTDNKALYLELERLYLEE